MANEQLNDVDQAYLRTQTAGRDPHAEKPVSPEELAAYQANWQDAAIPALQREVVAVQLEKLKRGEVDEVFAPVLEALRRLPDEPLSLLDAACASGYYSEVLRTTGRAIAYHGCDYNEAMVQEARRFYPELDFQRQDLTALGYADGAFDLVLASGVLEHIPAYLQALREISRVARRYFLLHRLPITSGSAHEHTVGVQYNIETPRTFYAEQQLLREIAALGWRLEQHWEVYAKPAKPRGLLKSLRRALKRALQTPAPTRTVRTYLFTRA